MTLASKSPRVLIVAHRLDLGGTEVHLARVIPALRRLGLDVSIFAIARGGALEAQLERDAVPVNGPPHSARFRRLRAVLSLRGELRRSRPDIVHFFLTEPYLLGSLAAAGTAGMVRIMSRRSLAHYQDANPILARVERWLHNSTRVLLGNSTAVVEQLAAECGDREKVGLIHNGMEMPPAVSADRRAAIRTELGIPADAFVLIVVANFFQYKGHDDLFEALAMIDARSMGPWRLLLVGRDQGAGAALRQKAAALGLAPNIVWLGERADAQALLDAADIAVLPSHQEGFSNSLIEKMARGLPAIATRVGGNIDAVVHRESGILVPVKDPPALMAAIMELRNDATLRARLGSAARSRVQKLFSLDGCVQRYLNLYNGVLDSNGISAQQMVDHPRTVS